MNLDCRGINNPNYKHGNCIRDKKYFCIDCGKEVSQFDVKRCKSCSKKGSLNSSYKDGRSSEKHYCIDCNKEIDYQTKTGLCISCSKSGERHPFWQGGKSYEIYPLGWNRTYKEQIRRRDEYKCRLCGIPETECSKRLAIHHIDYCKQNLLENNLISLCSSCHSKTNFDRNYWKEKFSNPCG